MSSTKKKFIGISIAVTVILSVSIVSNMQNRMSISDRSTISRTNMPSEFGNQALRNEILVLKNEIKQIKESNKNSQQFADELSNDVVSLSSQLVKLEETQHLTMHSSDVSAEGVNESAATILTQYQQMQNEQYTAEQNEARAQEETQAQMTQFESTMTDEDLDTEWSTNAQANLSNVFQTEEMNGMNLVDAECRSTLCRISVQANESVSLQKNFNKLMLSMPWQGQAFVEIKDGENGQGEAVIYLAREGHSLLPSTE